ncbi:bifunctional 2-polyprenyl-6-hydroxyphenol methylase/3-demethylubiquinol 3-O-methyltransferase UbiG [Paenibacillus sp. 7541]|uniref:class I SAM-dependent methyltransferase n=1 Tax=Paenibacillus sp. 7541 TaxID=2026236 RepID=UPI000BA6048B|nr:class I SAM-dependent methyltransferase [Paenibacillus sp. 7541]PAK49638.1 SAM-dependent methyltransferase [Paenibacillus sp. 7541]
MNEFFNAAIWEKAWKNDANTVISKMRKAGIDPSRSFDQKAEAFNEQSFNEEGRKRSRRIINWLEGQGVRFEHASVLDIGAASGVFTVPFAERGAAVTAIETSPPLIELLDYNIAHLTKHQVKIVPERFEDIDVAARGWNQAFDLVFVSMCPVVHDWDSVNKILQCARQFCYISMPVNTHEHSLVNEIWPLVTDQPLHSKPTEMAYLLHLLYLKGYAYESLITRETKSKELSAEEALEEAITWLRHHRLPVDERKRKIIADYLEQAYPSGKVVIQEGGRFGKVLIRLQDQNMYTREN